MRTTGLCLAVLLWPGTVWTSPQDDRAALARRLFIEVESAARLPRAQQADRLPRIYRDVCPRLDTMWVAHGMFGSPAAKPGETPAQAADRIEQIDGWPSLGEAGRGRCREFLAAHLDSVETLIRADLRGGRRGEKIWALRVIDRLRVVRLFDDAVAALDDRDVDPMYAAQALRAINDPRAIPHVARRLHDESTPLQDILRSLQENRPPHPMVLELLRSSEAKVRARAAYALADSHDPALIPIVSMVAADPAADVRRRAVQIAVSFDEAGYRRVQGTLIPLLSDADLSVRAEVAVAMAARKDRASAPTLLALMQQEDTLEPWRQSNVVQAIHRLTGSYFGLAPGTLSPARRGQALSDFAQWIKANPPE